MRERVIGFDIETWGDEPTHGLQPWRYGKTGHITLLGSAGCYPNRDYIKEAHWLPDWLAIRSLINDFYVMKFRVYGWNIQFDVAWLLAACLYHGDESSYNKVMMIDWWDTMLLFKRIDKMNRQRMKDEYKKQGIDFSYSLESCLKQFAPKLLDIKGADVHIPPTAKETSKEVIALKKRNILDAEFAAVMGEKFIKVMGETPAIIQEMDSISMFAESVVKGVDISKDKLKACGVQTGIIMKTAMSKLEEHGLTDKILASPKQLAEKLFDDWGLEPIKHSEKTGKPSVDKFSLIKLAQVDERVQDIMEYRGAKTIYDKYFKSILNSVAYNDYTGKSHPNPAIAGTYTGRCTYYSKTKEK